MVRMAPFFLTHGVLWNWFAAVRNSGIEWCNPTFTCKSSCRNKYKTEYTRIIIYERWTDKERSCWQTHRKTVHLACSQQCGECYKYVHIKTASKSGTGILKGTSNAQVVDDQTNSDLSEILLFPQEMATRMLCYYSVCEVLRGWYCTTFNFDICKVIQNYTVASSVSSDGNNYRPMYL